MCYVYFTTIKIKKERKRNEIIETRKGEMTYPRATAASGRSRLVCAKAMGSPCQEFCFSVIKHRCCHDKSLLHSRPSDGFLSLLKIQSKLEYHLEIKRGELQIRARTRTNLKKHYPQ